MSQSEPQLIFSHESSDGKVRVWQQNDRRWLDFDDGLIQSEIVLNHPETLPSPLNRAMLAGMMFVGQPQPVLLAGTGGGATARYVAHRFPDIKGEAIEKSEAVVAIARDYFDFPTTSNWRLIAEDIVTYVQHCRQQYDLVVIDIAVDQKTPAWITGQNFLQQCRCILTENGHVALNLLVDDAHQFLQYLAVIREVFDRCTVCFALPNYRNTVVLAFNTAPIYLPEEAEKRLPQLEEHWNLEFTEFYHQMLKDNPRQSGVF